MDCPVCSTTVEDGSVKCSHCQSDLEIYQLIVNANSQRQMHRKMISALAVFAAVTAIGWASVGVFSDKVVIPEPATEELCPEVELTGETRPQPSDAELVDLLRKENETLKGSNASLEAKLGARNTKTVEKASNSGEKGTILHTVRSGDTFWIIAKKYFNDGTKYKQVAKDNGMSVKQKLSKGMKLKIVKA